MDNSSEDGDSHERARQSMRPSNLATKDKLAKDLRAKLQDFVDFSYKKWVDENPLAVSNGMHIEGYEWIFSSQYQRFPSPCSYNRRNPVPQELHEWDPFDLKVCLEALKAGHLQIRVLLPPSPDPEAVTQIHSAYNPEPVRNHIPALQEHQAHPRDQGSTNTNLELGDRLNGEIEKAIGRKLVFQSPTPFNPLLDDKKPPNLYRWEFSDTYPCFPAGRLLHWSNKDVASCNEALQKGWLSVIPLHDSVSPRRQKYRSSSTGVMLVPPQASHGHPISQSQESGQYSQIDEVLDSLACPSLNISAEALGLSAKQNLTKQEDLIHKVIQSLKKIKSLSRSQYEIASQATEEKKRLESKLSEFQERCRAFSAELAEAHEHGEADGFRRAKADQERYARVERARDEASREEFKKLYDEKERSDVENSRLREQLKELQINQASLKGRKRFAEEECMNDRAIKSRNANNFTVQPSTSGFHGREKEAVESFYAARPTPLEDVGIRAHHTTTTKPQQGLDVVPAEYDAQRDSGLDGTTKPDIRDSIQAFPSPSQSLIPKTVQGFPADFINQCVGGANQLFTKSSCIIPRAVNWEQIRINIETHQWCPKFGQNGAINCVEGRPKTAQNEGKVYAIILREVGSYKYIGHYKLMRSITVPTEVWQAQFSESNKNAIAQEIMDYTWGQSLLRSKNLFVTLTDKAQVKRDTIQSFFMRPKEPCLRMVWILLQFESFQVDDYKKLLNLLPNWEQAQEEQKDLHQHSHLNGNPADPGSTEPKRTNPNDDGDDSKDYGGDHGNADTDNDLYTASPKHLRSHVPPASKSEALGSTDSLPNSRDAARVSGNDFQAFATTLP